MARHRPRPTFGTLDDLFVTHYAEMLARAQQLVGRDRQAAEIWSRGQSASPDRTSRVSAVAAVEVPMRSVSARVGRKYAILGGMMTGDAFMQAAIDEARQGLTEGGIPIGSVIVHDGRLIGRGHNRRVQRGSTVLHGEMDALENAGRLPATVYRACMLYTTLSPCAMCSGAILLYGIPHIIVGENQTFLGEEALLRSRGVRVDVLQDETCIALMTAFIRDKPQLWNEDIGE